MLGVQRLDCLNLYGLSLGIGGKTDRLADKLLAYQKCPNSKSNHETGRIELRANPLSPQRFLILQGHHRSFASYVHDEPVSGVVYDEDDFIEDVVARENFERGLGYHETAEALGIGTVPKLMDEELFSRYMKRLQTLRDGNREIGKLIRILESFWMMVS